MEDVYKVPTRPFTCEEDMKDAVKFRNHMTDHNKTKVCACCSRRREACQVNGVPFNEIKNLHLLTANHDEPDSAPTPELPREALTVFDGYCLQVRY